MDKVTDEMIGWAENIARTMHEGQTDKLGEPYIRHVQAVAELVEANWPSEQFVHHGIVVAWLHDVVEDTPMTFDTLSGWFPRSIMKAVGAITHIPHEPRPAYYARVKSNWIAHNVKIWDVRHNQSRLHLLPYSPLRERLTLKYLEAEIALVGTEE